MSVSNTNNRWEYTGDGTSAAFVYDNLILAASDLQVYVDGALKTLTTDYAVSNVGVATGGAVTFVVAPAAGAKIAIVSAIPSVQPTALAAISTLPSAVIEGVFDRLTRLVQQLAAKLGRVLALPDGETGAVSTTLPAAALRASKVLAFNAAGAPVASNLDLAAIELAPAAQTAAAASAAAAAASASAAATSAGGIGVPTVQTFNGDGVTTAFTLSAAPPSPNAIQIFIAGVHQARDRFSFVGTALTFAVAPPAGTNNIEVRVGAINLTTNLPASNVTGQLAIANGGTGAADAPAARSALGLGSADAPSFAGVNGGPLAGMRNAFVNGGFDVWQLGASITVGAGATAYTADQLEVSATGAAVTVSRQPGRGPTLWCARIAGQAGVTACFAQGKIESLSASGLANAPTTWSIWLFNNTGAAFTPTLDVHRANATDDFSAVTAEVAGQTLQLCPDNAWTKLSYSFTPSSGAGTGLRARVNFGGAVNGAGKYVQLSEMQFEPGGVATTFERRSPAFELAQCQRYLRLYGGQSSVEFLPGGAMGTSTTTAELTIGYPSMRAAPTVTVSAAADWGVTSASAFTAATGLSANTITRDTLRLAFTVASGLTANQFYLSRANSTTAARIILDARL